VQDVEAYLKTTRDTLSFVAHLGRLRDMFKKMDGALTLGDSLWKQFNDFYSSRNSYLHGPIPAHKFVDGLIKIPTPAGRVAVGSKWTDESRWTDSNRFSFEFVSDFFRHTTKEAIELTRSGISQCLTRLKELEPDLTTPLQVSYGSSFGVEAPPPPAIQVIVSGSNHSYSRQDSSTPD
jgi:hypothetical protein